MIGTFNELGHFAAIAISNILAIMCIFTVLAILKHAGWRLPCEPRDILKLFATLGGHMSRSRVNVEFRDAAKAILELGDCVHATIRSCHGHSFRYEDGYFRACTRESMAAGSEVVVNIGDRVRETLVVQVSNDKHTLFVQSQFTDREIFDQINHKCALSVSKMPSARSRAISG